MFSTPAIADPRTGFQLAMLGLTHRDAAVAVRERCRLSPEQLEGLIVALRSEGLLGGCVYLQTCNRVELYFTAADPAAVATAFQQALGATLEADQRESLEWSTREGQAALSHLFRVTASLDSLVLGDTEIMGQVRRAYETAQKSGQTDKLLNLACQWALKVGKGVRTHTTIQQRAASVASLVAQELRNGDPSAPIVVLGAGEIAQAVLRNLKKGSRPLVVLNRSEASLASLAKDYQFTAGRLQDFIDHVGDAAALVSCLAVEQPFIDAIALAAATADRVKPLKVYDLGVPRNIDPQAKALPMVHLRDMDDLQATVEANKAGRAEAAAGAEHWVAGQVADFALMWVLQPLAPALQAIRGRKSAPPAELTALLEPHLGSLPDAALTELLRQLGPAARTLPAHLQNALAVNT